MAFLLTILNSGIVPIESILKNCRKIIKKIFDFFIQNHLLEKGPICRRFLIFDRFTGAGGRGSVGFPIPIIC
ncbi:MAG: hypothetical protein D6785_00900 [Planctomycetota bacterium]|nr:MAG: hypothetical protein D6785_00900 [Planctomycetota bacterium]